MNRFSPLPTLSKFKTGVRETVDFVSKNLPQLAVALCFSVLALPAIAQDTRPAGAVYVQTTPDRIRECRASFKAAKAAAIAMTDAAGKKEALEAAQDDLDRCLPAKQENASAKRCEDAATKLEELGTKATQSCSKIKSGMALKDCSVKIEVCKKSERDLDELFQDDEGGRENYCNRMLANNCPTIPDFNTGRDYRDEKRDAERDRKEAKKLVDELTSDQNDLKKDLVKQQRELQEEQMKAAYVARQKERELSNEMKDALAGISAEQKKAFADAQKTYNDMDMAYIEMRAQIRAADDAIATAGDAKMDKCFVYAQEKFDLAERERKAELAKRSSNVGSSVSGSTARRKAATARTRNINYSAYLAECNARPSSEIKDAERKKASLTKLLNDKAAKIEEQRTKILKQLQDMESEATNQQTKVVETINEKLTAMSEQQQLTAQLNQQRITEFQQNQSSSMASIQQKLMTANQEMMETQKEASLATTRLSCQGTSGQRSESLREKFTEGFGSYGLIEEAKGKCKTFSATCSTVATPTFCAVFTSEFDEAVKKARPLDVESRSSSGTVAP